MHHAVCVVILTEIIALELQYFAKMKLNMFFSSAIDENEVALCIKDLNAPDFHASILSGLPIHLKDMESELLTKLLINLTQDGLLSEAQLDKG